MALELVEIGDYPPLDTTCLRCGEPAALPFAGPCGGCASELREQFAGESRVVDAVYVPKMNVTPNAVALKDD